MRVISQNRDYSFDFERALIHIQDCYIQAMFGTEMRLIGTYKSDVRAVEVFKEIHDVYEDDNACVYYLPEE